MLIYLIRHAHALDGKDDAARPLGKKGRKQIRDVARWLRKSGGLKAREFWHSPLVRSIDTARCFVRHLRSRGKLVPVGGLLHDDDPAIMLRRLDKVAHPVAVVGHDPHLSALASLLVTGSAKPPRFVLKKCAVLALEKTDAGWAVRWQ